MGRVRYNHRMEEEEEDSRESEYCSSMEEEEEDDDSSSDGPLHDLSDLMNQLPIKRGLSRFYEGKSRSFTSLANVKSIEDIVKKKWKANQWKTSSSCRLFSPKPIISKRETRKPSALSLCIKATFINQNPP